MGDYLDEAGALVTGGGRRVPALEVSAATFLDRSTAIYGGSGTGKSHLVKSFLALLRPHVCEAIVISPSEPTNRSYAGIVPAPLIHYSVLVDEDSELARQHAERQSAGGAAGRGGAGRARRPTKKATEEALLTTIMQRQEIRMATYNRANRPEVLARLVARLPAGARERGAVQVRALEAKRAQTEARVRASLGGGRGSAEQHREKLAEVQELFDRLTAFYQKQQIATHHAALWQDPGLTEDERFTMSYLYFNPRLVLVFDDCADELKPLLARPIFRTLFYRGRHSGLTTIFCFQDDTDAPANIRKNVFTSFYTTDQVCASNFDRTSNKYPKAVQKLIQEAAPSIYAARHRKLAWVREDPTGQGVYHYTAPRLEPFRIGPDALWELCGRVEGSGDAVNFDNPFASRFGFSREDAHPEDAPGRPAGAAADRAPKRRGGRA